MTGQDTCCTAIITRRQNVLLVQGTGQRAFHDPTHSPPRVCGNGPVQCSVIPITARRRGQCIAVRAVVSVA